MITTVHKYPHNFFMSSEYNKYTPERNIPFWIYVDDLCRRYPDEEIVIELILRCDPRISFMFYEDVRIQNTIAQIKEEFDRIYKRYYYGVPLLLYPEFEGRKDIIEDLKRIAQENASGHD